MDSEILTKNTILEIKVGSHLYGTNTETSDVDYAGIFIPPIDYYFGLKSVEEVDLSIVSKLDNGKNSSDAVDKKLYELRKFVKLALENNPSIIEMLFVTPENIFRCDSLGEFLLSNKKLFPYKECYRRFKGYSISQQKKMLVKSGNMNDLKGGLEKITYFHLNETKNNDNFKYVFEIENHLINSGYFSDNGNQHLKIGDIYIQKNITIKKAIEQIVNRISKFGNRKELVEDYGYDTKFASHCVRLLAQCEELLLTGEIVFPLKDRQLILDIKGGKYNLKEISEMIEMYEDFCDEAYEKSILPSKPNYNKINDILIEMIETNYIIKRDINEL